MIQKFKVLSFLFLFFASGVVVLAEESALFGFGDVYLVFRTEEGSQIYKKTAVGGEWRKIYSSPYAISFAEIHSSGTLLSFVEWQEQAHIKVLDIRKPTAQIFLDVVSLKHPSSGLRIGKFCDEGSISFAEGNSVFDVYRLNIRSGSWAMLTNLKGESTSSDYLFSSFYAFDHSATAYSGRLQVFLKTRSQLEEVSVMGNDARKPRISTDGSKLAYLMRESGTGPYDLVIWDRHSKEKLRFLMSESYASLQWLGSEFVLLSSDLYPESGLLVHLESQQKSPFDLSKGLPAGEIKSVLVSPRSKEEACQI